MPSTLPHVGGRPVRPAAPAHFCVCICTFRELLFVWQCDAEHQKKNGLRNTLFLHVPSPVQAPLGESRVVARCVGARWPAARHGCVPCDGDEGVSGRRALHALSHSSWFSCPHRLISKMIDLLKIFRVRRVRGPKHNVNVLFRVVGGVTPPTSCCSACSTTRRQVT